MVDILKDILSLFCENIPNARGKFGTKERKSNDERIFSQIILFFSILQNFKNRDNAFLLKKKSYVNVCK